VDPALRNKSPVLRKLTVPVPGAEGRHAVVLGYGRLYMKSREPNLLWGYLSADEVLLWAAEDVPAGQEFSVDFSAPPEPTDKPERRRPLTFQQPPLHCPGAPEKYGGSGSVMHGISSLHGRGVFVTKDVPAGQLIESCPVVRMDEAGAEALTSYRWGIIDGFEGSFYVPMGLGSLYNHSEQPNTCARLDLGRSVLELKSLEPLHTGQEVLVNYGEDYFAGDQEGHRKSDLLKVEEVHAEDLDVRAFGALQQALIGAFSDEGVQQELERLRRPLDPQPDETPEARLRAETGRWKQRHKLIMQAQLPILERFGFRRNVGGAKEMSDYIGVMGLDPRVTDEMRQQTVDLNRLVHG